MTKPIYLTKLNTPHWLLIQPIPLSSRYESNGDVLVWDSIVGQYGIGTTLGAALADYESSLTEYYELIAEAPNNIHNRTILNELRKYIQPR